MKTDINLGTAILLGLGAGLIALIVIMAVVYVQSRNEPERVAVVDE